MGHSKIQTTFDVYGHFLPGSYDDVRERMDAYLAQTARPSVAVNVLASAEILTRWIKGFQHRDPGRSEQAFRFRE
jgi:hypothetical protein